jgi:lipopolysaccharide transport system permease protein
MSTRVQPEPELVLGSRPVALRLLLHDLWASRPLVAMLARRDFFVRYRRASLGLVWAVVVPVSQALVLALVFSHFASLHHGGTNYALFILTGTVPFAYLSGALSPAATSIVDGSDLSSKIYFPRAVLPLAAVGSSAYGLLLNVGVLLVLTPILGGRLGLRTLLLVPAIAIAILLAASLALVLSALHVYFRDVRYLLEAAQRVWFYATPIFYELAKVGRLRLVLEANPATGMVELFRAATIGAEASWVPALASTLGWTVALTVVGIEAQRRYDRLFADLL